MTLSTIDVMSATGASYRQLDYWCRSGLIEGQSRSGVGSGHRREWSARDLARARALYAVSRIRALPMIEVMHELERTGMLSAIERQLGLPAPQPSPPPQLPPLTRRVELWPSVPVAAPV